MTEDFVQSTGQPRLSMLVDDINKLDADLSSLLKGVSTAAGLIALFGMLQSGSGPDADAFKTSLGLFDESPSGQHVIAALCDGLRAARSTSSCCSRPTRTTTSGSGRWRRTTTRLPAASSSSRCRMAAGARRRRGNARVTPTTPSRAHGWGGFRAIPTTGEEDDDHTQ